MEMLDFYENQTTLKGHKSQNYLGILFKGKADLLIKSSVFLPFTNGVSLIFFVCFHGGLKQFQFLISSIWKKIYPGMLKFVFWGMFYKVIALKHGFFSIF